MKSWHPTEPDFLAQHFRARQERDEIIARRAHIAIAAAGRILQQVADGVRAGAAGAARRYRLWRQWHAARQALLKLDDRLLRDIGLTRADALDPRPLLDAPPAFDPPPLIDVALQPAEVRRCNDNRSRLAA